MNTTKKMQVEHRTNSINSLFLLRRKLSSSKAKSVMIMLLFVLLPFSATSNTDDGYDFEVDGIYYKIIEDEASVIYKNHVYEPHIDYYENDYTGDVIIPASVTYDGKTYSVTSIYERAFSSCFGMTSVTLPNTITSIGHNAFDGCSGLTSIEIPNSVTFVGYGAFSDCSELTEVSTTDIAAWCSINFGDYYANPLVYAHHLYLNGTEVTDLTIPETVTAIGLNAFSGCKGLISLEVPNSVTSIGYSAFYGCSGLTWARIGNSVTSIDNATFMHCTSLSSVTLGSAVTAIGQNAFDGCTSLKSIRIPDSVTSIGNNAFNGCSGLTTVSIGNSVNDIRSYAFYNCTSLSTVDIGKSVRDIGKNAFQNAPAIETITCRAIYPAWWEDMSMFSSGVYEHAQLHVPEGSEGAYKADHYWGQFLTIIGDVNEENPDGDVNGDGEVTIADANSVIDVVIMGGNAGHTRIPATDVNGDGEVSIADVNAIIDIILKND